MLSALLLYALATVDGALVGYRVASGRSALVDKGSYYWRSLLRAPLLLRPAAGLRPFVVVAGVLWAALASLRPEILLMATFLAALMLAFEPLLERRRPRV